MHRIDEDGHVANLFSEGNPSIGQVATKVGDDWLNDVQEELCEAVEAAGIPLVKGTRTQLRDAIRTLASAQPVVAASIVAGTLALDVAAGHVFEVTIDANITTFTITGWLSGVKDSIELWCKGNGAAFTQAWGAVRWPADVAPVLTTVNGDYTVLTFHRLGSATFGLTAAQDW